MEGDARDKSREWERKRTADQRIRAWQFNEEAGLDFGDELLARRGCVQVSTRSVLRVPFIESIVEARARTLLHAIRKPSQALGRSLAVQSYDQCSATHLFAGQGLDVFASLVDLAGRRDEQCTWQHRRQVELDIDAAVIGFLRPPDPVQIRTLQSELQRLLRLNEMRSVTGALRSDHFDVDERPIGVPGLQLVDWCKGVIIRCRKSRTTNQQHKELGSNCYCQNAAIRSHRRAAPMRVSLQDDDRSAAMHTLSGKFPPCKYQLKLFQISLI